MNEVYGKYIQNANIFFLVIVKDNFLLVTMLFSLNPLFQFDAVIQQGNEGVVHHMILYQCKDDFPRSNLSYEGAGDSPDMPPAVARCSGPSTIAGWAIGGKVCVTLCRI